MFLDSASGILKSIKDKGMQDEDGHPLKGSRMANKHLLYKEVSLIGLQIAAVPIH